jgi:hypothetical protein
MRIPLRALSIIAAAASLAATLLSCSFQAPRISAPRYALVYGVSIYQSAHQESSAYYPYVPANPQPASFFNLSYSDDDSKDFSTEMTTQDWTVLERIKGSAGNTAAQPTKAQMNLDIDDLAATIGSDSTVLIYFSGHGTLVGGTSYIVPYLGISDSLTPSVDYSLCVSPSDLGSMISRLPTKNVIVILDTCYSGGFASSSGAMDASPSNYSSMAAYSAFGSALANFGSLLAANASASGDKATIVLSAAGSRELSYETREYAHGVFTYYLLEAAARGDRDGDGAITVTEAYSYAAEAIKSKFNLSYGAAFLPHISGDTRDLVLFMD